MFNDMGDFLMTRQARREICLLICEHLAAVIPVGPALTALIRNYGQSHWGLMHLNQMLSPESVGSATAFFDQINVSTGMPFLLCKIIYIEYLSYWRLFYATRPKVLFLDIDFPYTNIFWYRFLYTNI